MLISEMTSNYFSPLKTPLEPPQSPSTTEKGNQGSQHEFVYFCLILLLTFDFFPLKILELYYQFIKSLILFCLLFWNSSSHHYFCYFNVYWDQYNFCFHSIFFKCQLCCVCFKWLFSTSFVCLPLIEYIVEIN